MEDNTFIKYTRSLHTNPLFKGMSFEYRHIYMTILVNMAFKPIQLNDHGVIIELKSGQLMTTVRGLVKLCDEKSIDLPKVQRALRMFENMGFSTQETIHRKTIITITESSICESLKNKIDTRNDTKSIQDRYTKEEVKERQEEEHTHQEIKRVVGGCDIISFDKFSIEPPSLMKSPITNENHNFSMKPPEEKKYENPIEERRIEFTQRFGEEGLIELTANHHQKLLSKMSQEEFDYWVLQIEREMRRQGENEFNQKNKSHYHAILAFKEFREGKGTSPFIKKSASKENVKENLEYAQRAEKNLKSKTHQLSVSYNYVEIVPSNGSSKTESINYTENAFKEQLNNLLNKKGFERR